MRVFSFNKVIYDGYLSFDLFIFIIRQQFSRLFSFFSLFPFFIKFVMRKINSTTLVEQFYKIVLDNITVSELNLFKTSNLHKIDLEGFGIVKDNNNDLIVSAEPSFLIDLFINRNKFNVVCTGYDIRNRRIVGKLCLGAEKVRRLKKLDINSISQLFIYSFKEKALMSMGEYIFIYRHHEVIEYDSYQGNLMDKVFYNILNRKLLTFISVSFIFSLIYVVLSSILAIFINDLIAFILGYIIWMVVTFYSSYTYIKSAKFEIQEILGYVLSFIPNFLLQLWLVLIFVVLIGLPTGIILFISNIIAFPLLIFIIRFYNFD